MNTNASKFHRAIVQLISVFAVAIFFDIDFAAAQVPVPQVRVQLPNVSSFQINTAVSVPDAGIRSLGGISRSGYGSSTFGTPLAGGVPGLGRGFGNFADGGFYSPGSLSLSASIISNRELEEDLLGRANRQERVRQTINPNGSPAVQRQADFISRNVGRRK